MKKKTYNRRNRKKELNVPKEDIIISMDAIQEPISLQEPVYGDNTDNIYVMDQISDKKKYR